MKKYLLSSFGSNIVNAVGKIISFAFLASTLDQTLFSSLMIQITIVEVLALCLDFGHSKSIFTHTTNKEDTFFEFCSIFLFKTLILLSLSFILYSFGFTYLFWAVPLVLYNFKNFYYARKFSFNKVLWRNSFDTFLRVIMIFLISSNYNDTNIILLLFYFPIILIVFYDTIHISLKNKFLKDKFLPEINTRIRKLQYYTKHGFYPYLDSLMIVILRRGDIFYLNYFLGEIIAGQYAALFALIKLLPMINSSVNRVFFSYTLENKDTVKKIKNNRNKIIFFGFSFAFLTSLFIVFVYHITYPAEIQLPFSISILTLIAVGVNFPYQTLILPLYKLKRLDFAVKIRIVQLLAQTICSIMFIKMYGVIGVAMSLLAVRVIGILMINAFLGKQNV